MRAFALVLTLLLSSVLPARAFFSLMSRLFMGKPKRPYTGVSRAHDALRGECARTAACAAFAPGAEQDCVLHCLSPTCWAREYAAAPLEPGEIDAAPRTKRYNQCLIVQEGAMRATPGLWPPQLRQSTGTVVEALEEVDEFAASGGAGL